MSLRWKPSSIVIQSEQSERRNLNPYKMPPNVFGKGVSRRICVVILRRNLRFCLVRYKEYAPCTKSAYFLSYSHLRREKYHETVEGL